MSVSNPTNFKPGDKSGADAILVTAVNVGGAAAGCTPDSAIETERTTETAHTAGCVRRQPGGPITIGDALPAAECVEVFGVNAYHDPLSRAWPVEQFGPTDGLSCTSSPAVPPARHPNGSIPATR